MKRNDERKLDIISDIDDGLLEKATQTRLLLANKLKKRASRAWIGWAAMAACLCLVVGTVLALLPGLLSSGKQVPIYQGMTVSNTNPMGDSASAAITPDAPVLSTLAATTSPRVSFLSEVKPTPTKPVPPHEKATDGNTESITDASEPSLDVSSGVYYAKQDEDFYITVHISNPDNFEILSFTLNGTKYSSYMFEQGSNMESLVLKCNVGDAEGTVTYTIDAIKYVDGQQIKDVRMEGDKTVTILVYPKNQPTVSMGDTVADKTGITLTPTVTDALSLIADSEGELLVKLYDGDTLVAETPFVSGESVTFTGLAPETAYRYAVIAVYDAIDGQGKVAHVLHEGTATTSPVITFEDVEVTGLTASFTLSGDVGSITALGLYEGETLYRELTIGTREIEHLPIDKEVTLIATYTLGDTSYRSSYTLPLIQESKGLHIVDGVVVGMGTCTDTVLYLNHPIKDAAFRASSFITAVYCDDGVTDIGNEAFGSCTALRSITLSQNLSRIQNNAFDGCSALDNVVIPNSVTSIGEWAFGNCTSLTRITILDGVTDIGQYAFASCTSLSDVTIPDSVTSIGLAAFKGCSSLTELPTMNGVTSIGADTFSNCSSLTDVVIGTGVTSIPDGMFEGCTSLRRVIIPDGVQHIGNSAFEGCTGLTQIVIPDSVTSIYCMIFYNCTSLTDVVLGTGITCIEAQMFDGCTSLRRVVIPDSVTVIHDMAFYRCVGLTEVVIPDSVTSIESNAFYGCTGLTDVYFTGTEAQWKKLSQLTTLKYATVHYNYQP